MFQCFPMMNIKKSLNLKSYINNVISYLIPCCFSFIFLGHAFDLRAFGHPFPFFFFFLEALKRSLDEPRRGFAERSRDFWYELKLWSNTQPLPRILPKIPFHNCRLLLIWGLKSFSWCFIFSVSLYKSKPVWLPPRKQKMIYGRAGMRLWKTVWRGSHVHLL